jgi:hypothetical protein
MKLDASPAATYAVLVGIEQYGLGIRPLVGPAIDAMSMCCWMLDKGVPATNLLLLINEAATDKPEVHAERERLRTLISEHGVAVQPPDQHLLDGALSAAVLARDGLVDGSVLWVYWSGHGLLNHATRERMGVAGNATGQDYHVVDLETTWTALRLDPRLRRLSRQVLIVDACSTWSKPATPLRSLSQTVGAFRATDTQQVRIYAALNGQTSEIAAGELKSDFTTHLLSCLAPSAPYALDLDELLSTLRTSSKEGAKPFAMQLEDGLGNSFGHFAGHINQRAGELASLVHHSPAFPVETLRRLFRRVTTCAADTCPRSSRDIVLQLDDFPPDSSGLSNSERFAIFLKVRCDHLLSDLNLLNRDELLALRDGLSAWNAHTDQPLLTSAMDSLRAQEREPGRVFIDLGPEETRAWVWREGAWQPIVRCADADAPALARIQSVIAGAVKEQIGLKNCHIELAVALDDVSAAPLGESVSLGLRPMRLGMEISLTLRIRDRWSRGELMTNWLSAWDACRHRLEASGELVWLDPSLPAGAAGIDVLQCLSMHLTDEQHVQSLLFHLEDGALWALGCAPVPDPATRSKLDHHVSLAALRDWLAMARTLAQVSTTSAGKLLLVADVPADLPDGVADPLNLPQ